MSHISAYNLGILAGVAVALIVAAIFAAASKKRGGAGKFDERQQLIRGKAYQHAFFVTLCVSALYGVLVAFTERSYMADGVAALLTVFVGIAEFGAESILRDAFYTAKDRPKVYILLYVACILSQIAGTVGHIRAGDIVQDGVLTMNVLPLACTVLFSIILICLIIKTAQQPKEDEDE